MHRRLESNTVRFPNETIEGETILIDADKGVLLLLSGSAPWIWDRFTGGADCETVLAEIAGGFGDAAAAQSGAFIDSMLAIGLLVPARAAEAPAAPLPSAFEPPAIETFEDISEIIMMDPIHDVDSAAGWPNADPGSR